METEMNTQDEKEYKDDDEGFELAYVFGNDELDNDEFDIEPDVEGDLD